MDTKLKKKYKFLNGLLVTIIFAAVLVSGIACADFNVQGTRIVKEKKEALKEAGFEYQDTGIARQMIEGSYALYAESIETWEDDLIADVDNQDYIKARLADYGTDFSRVRKSMDFTMAKKAVVEHKDLITPETAEEPVAEADEADKPQEKLPATEVKEDVEATSTPATEPEPQYNIYNETVFTPITTNTVDDLMLFVPEYYETYGEGVDLSYLSDKYVLIIAVEYDGAGNISVINAYNKDGLKDDYIRDVVAYQKFVQYGEDAIGAGAPRNTIYVYALDADNDLYPNYKGQQRIDEREIYQDETAYFPFMSAVLCVLALASLILGRPRLTPEGTKKVLCIELAVILALVAGVGPLAAFDLYYEYAKGAIALELFAPVYGALMLLVYYFWCASFVSFRTLFAEGWKKYRENNCFFYMKSESIKAYRLRLKEEVEHLNLDDETGKTIKRVVVLNFFLLAVLCCCWWIGVFLLIPYGMIMTRVLKKHAAATRDQKNLVKEAASDIASGNFATPALNKDMGMFNDVRDELVSIADGFSAAVIEETKQSRMKTELVTNVSHDLKTPLTAITTYVELLKSPDLDEEKRKEYIDVLERKSLRLKALIEDLFELSKASSDTMNLELADLNVCHLIKQVATEQEDKLAARNLKLVYTMPEEIILSLDGAKAYRIFENLFVNASKYALEGTRVYVDAEEDEEAGKVTISMANISEAELNFKPEEITERFVRGDVSRNTEGSGLGLAIVKSFTEAMGGTFEIKTDKDLFKAIVTWNKQVKNEEV